MVNQTLILGLGHYAKWFTICSLQCKWKPQDFGKRGNFSFFLNCFCLHEKQTSQIEIFPFSKNVKERWPLRKWLFLNMKMYYLREMQIKTTLRYYSPSDGKNPKDWKSALLGKLQGNTSPNLELAELQNVTTPNEGNWMVSNKSACAFASWPNNSLPGNYSKIWK